MRQTLIQTFYITARGVLICADDRVVIFFGVEPIQDSGILNSCLGIFNGTGFHYCAFGVQPAFLIPFKVMAQSFAAGDDLIFQLESGFGLLRVIAVEQRGKQRIWHLMAYEELFPDVDAAERALAQPNMLHIRKAHMALTERAFERTPAARLGNRTITDAERAIYAKWVESNGEVSDRSALLMLGLR